MAGSQQPNGAGAMGGTYQDALTSFCRNNGTRPPSWQAISDRRGGRTAWSCIVQVSGLPSPVQARFWYDGQYVNSAREDAAQVALLRLGQLPPSGGAPAAGMNTQPQQPQPPQQPQQQQQQQQYPNQQPQQSSYQQQNQQQQPGSSSQSSQQHRYYGVIGS